MDRRGVDTCQMTLVDKFGREKIYITRETFERSNWADSPAGEFASGQRGEGTPRIDFPILYIGRV